MLERWKWWKEKIEKMDVGAGKVEMVEGGDGEEAEGGCLSGRRRHRSIPRLPPPKSAIAFPRAMWSKLCFSVRGR